MYTQHLAQTIDETAYGTVRALPEHVDDRRDSHRTRTVYRVAHVQARGDEGLARIRNISDSGMKLSLGLPVMLGDIIRVALSDTTILKGRVVWTDGEECGIQFAKPINSFAALRETAEQSRAGDARPPRLRTVISALTSSERGLVPVKVHDVSQRGMKVAHDGSFAPGLAVKVQLPAGVERRGVVRWARDNLAGLILTEPFSVADLGAVSAL